MGRFNLLPDYHGKALSRSEPLCRGLLFATVLNSPGHDSALLSSTIDSVYRSRPTWQATPASNAYGVLDAGRFANGRAVVSAYLNYPSPAPRYDVTVDCSVFMVVRPSTLSPAQARRILRKRTSAGGPGYLMAMTTGNLWNLQISDGTGVPSVTTTTTASTGRTDTICGTYKSASTLNIYCNGALEATASTSTVCAASSDNLLLFGTRTTPLDGWDGSIFMAAVWNRVLPNQSVARLHSDPFLLWRQRRTRPPVGQLSSFWPMM